MADIHIYTAGGEPRVLPEDQIAGLLKSGELSPDEFFWREGMNEWEPLAKFHASPPAPHDTIVPPRRTEPLPDVSAHWPPHVEAAPTFVPIQADPENVTGRQRYRFRKSPEPLTTIVQVLLIICLIVAALELANGIVQYGAMTSAPSGPPAVDLSGAPVAMPGTAVPPDDAGWMLEWIDLGANVLLIVPYFMWLYRANQNCRGFSLIMRFKPKWAVGCHFVPPMNVFRPCQVVQEIWRVSNNPRTWHNDRRSVLVGIWWALTLGTIGLAIFNGIQSYQAATVDDHTQVELVFLVLKGIQIAWYGTFLAMVVMIIQKQTRVVRNSKRKAEALEEEEEEAGHESL